MRGGRSDLLARIDTIVDQEGLEVKRRGSFLDGRGIHDSSSDVRNVETSVTLSSDVKFLAGELSKDSVYEKRREKGIRGLGK